MSPILVVEDNEINAEILTTLLESQGIRTTYVDGIESYNAPITQRLLFVNIDGHPHAPDERLRSRPENQDRANTAPIIAQTATHTTEESISEQKNYIAIISTNRSGRISCSIYSEIHGRVIVHSSVA